MKKITLFIVSILACFSFSGCSMGLDDQPAFNKHDITAIKFERRVIELRDVAIVINGVTEVIQEEVVVFKPIGVSTSISAPDKLIASSTSLSTDISNMVCTVSISPGAKIEPINGAPRFGAVGDYGVDRQYKITSANKKECSVWTIRVDRK